MSEKYTPSEGALAAAYEIISAGFGDPAMADEQAVYLAKIIDAHTDAPQLLKGCRDALEQQLRDALTPATPTQE